ncbi:hypothetical protein P879_04664 [Paragonimus westermani]|uniref:Uncharacterized protein n=1 Tax=Paragonimus westermani TaxID=34504 RepID=A0A8T0DJ86_9TREM|nr:hypothetical protein P879_04664 [Paragonimus westermani]
MDTTLMSVSQRCPKEYIYEICRPATAYRSDYPPRKIPIIIPVRPRSTKNAFTVPIRSSLVARSPVNSPEDNTEIIEDIDTTPGNTYSLEYAGHWNTVRDPEIRTATSSGQRANNPHPSHTFLTSRNPEEYEHIRRHRCYSASWNQSATGNYSPHRHSEVDLIKNIVRNQPKIHSLNNEALKLLGTLQNTTVYQHNFTVHLKKNDTMMSSPEIEELRGSTPVEEMKADQLGDNWEVLQNYGLPERDVHKKPPDSMLQKHEGASCLNGPCTRYGSNSNLTQTAHGIIPNATDVLPVEWKYATTYDIEINSPASARWRMFTKLNSSEPRGYIGCRRVQNLLDCKV